MRDQITTPAAGAYAPTGKDKIKVQVLRKGLLAAECWCIFFRQGFIWLMIPPTLLLVMQLLLLSFIRWTLRMLCNLGLWLCQE